MPSATLESACMPVSIRACVAGDARRLLLGVWGGNHRALAFYARQGFTEAGRKAFGSSAYDDLVLGRPL